MSGEKRIPFGAAALLGIGLSLPFYLFFYRRAVSESLWIDEFDTWWVTNQSLLTIFSDVRPYANHAPYYAGIWIWRSLFGDSEISMRLPSLLIDLCTTALCLDIARLLFFRAGRSLAGLVFIVPCFLFQSDVFWNTVNAREYSIGVFFAAAAVDAAIRYLSTGKLKLLALSGVFGALTVLVHPLFPPVLGVLALSAVILPAAKARGAAIREMAVGLAMTCAAIAALFYQFGYFTIVGRLGHSYPHRRFSGADIFRAYRELFPPTDLMLLSIELTALLAVARLLRRGETPANSGRDLFPKEYSRPVLFLLCWILISPVGLVALAAYMGQDLLYFRYTGFCLPAWAILLGIIPLWIYERAPKVGAVIVVICPLVFVYLLKERLFYDGWREGVQSVCNSAAAPDSLAFVYGHPDSAEPEWQSSEYYRSAWSAPVTYYCRAANVVPDPPPNSMGPDSEIGRLLEKKSRVFLFSRCFEDKGCDSLEQPLKELLLSKGFQSEGSSYHLSVRVTRFHNAGAG